jgi:hypothetical protein
MNGLMKLDVHNTWIDEDKHFFLLGPFVSYEKNEVL